MWLHRTAVMDLSFKLVNNNNCDFQESDVTATLQETRPANLWSSDWQNYKRNSKHKYCMNVVKWLWGSDNSHTKKIIHQSVKMQRRRTRRNINFNLANSFACVHKLIYYYYYLAEIISTCTWLFDIREQQNTEDGRREGNDDVWLRLQNETRSGMANVVADRRSGRFSCAYKLYMNIIY